MSAPIDDRVPASSGPDAFDGTRAGCDDRAPLSTCVGEDELLLRASRLLRRLQAAAAACSALSSWQTITSCCKRSSVLASRGERLVDAASWLGDRELLVAL